MRRLLAVALVGVFTVGRVEAAAPHLAGASEVAARMEAAARLRADRVTALQAALSTPAAREEAARRGVSAATLSARVPSLSDAELADLTARAAQAPDVVAGHHPHDGLAIVGVVLLVAALVVLAAAGDWDDDYYDDCYCY